MTSDSRSLQLPGLQGSGGIDGQLRTTVECRRRGGELAQTVAERCTPAPHVSAPRPRLYLASYYSHQSAVPPSAVQSDFIRYFAADFLNPGHDQYIHCHANGLCVIGLAPTHVALREEGWITAVDFNVGKVDRSGIKVNGKRKRNAHHFETKPALCKVSANGVQFSVKGSLLEVNDRLIKDPALLNSSELLWGCSAGIKVAGNKAMIRKLVSGTD